MKTQIALTLCLLVAVMGMSQDKIYLHDGSHIEAKVLEINQLDIKYKKYSNLEGPTYTVDKSTVMMIINENGETEVIKSQPSTGVVNNEPIVYGRNVLGINPIHLIFSSVTFGYERISKTGNSSVYVPLTYILGYRYASLYTGVDFRMYPFGQKTSSFFIGGGTRFGSINRDSYVDGRFITGFSFQPSKSFNITLDGAVGAGNWGGSIVPAYSIGVSIGPRF